MSEILHSRVDGPADGPPLVLLGSLGSTIEMWEPNLPVLAERFRVVRLDHLGHGGSPAPEGPYTMARLADAALATLDSLGLERVAWCGLSLGGMVGLYLGSERPERISRLALCCTSSYFPDRTAWPTRIAGVEADGTGGLAAAIVEKWFTPDWAAAHPAEVARAVGWVADSPDDGYLACCRAIEAWDHRDRLGAVTAPTLVLGGESDRSTPVEPHSRTIAAGIPGARLEVVRGAHLATIENPEETNRLLLEHLRD
ncbi:3-oxoadipate enol-lactonase [Pseudonocardia ailaonensis]|uniref:3-oxoadipate enol-lactonase n=1 Tax=Pseudonocardia ailaonensis TaxID=367279 RepID=A0ABN2N8I9_9PSEU